MGMKQVRTRRKMGEQPKNLDTSNGLEKGIAGGVCRCATPLNPVSRSKSKRPCYSRAFLFWKERGEYPQENGRASGSLDTSNDLKRESPEAIKGLG